MTDQKENKEVKSNYWIMNIEQLVEAKVVFEEEVTAEQAENAFHYGYYDDILDENIVRIDSVEAEKAII